MWRVISKLTYKPTRGNNDNIKFNDTSRNKNHKTLYKLVQISSGSLHRIQSFNIEPKRIQKDKGSTKICSPTEEINKAIKTTKTSIALGPKMLKYIYIGSKVTQYLTELLNFTMKTSMYVRTYIQMYVFKGIPTDLFHFFHLSPSY